ncbi:hemin uptake protein HemP [Rhodanobacter lindaniclasticus]
MSVLSMRSPSFSPAPRRVAMPPSPAEAPAARQVTSERLLGGRRELVIQHQGSQYHLRLTRNDKLILTK